MAYDHSWQSIFSPGSGADFFHDARPAGFAVDADGFNPINAWWLSELSRLIYRRDAAEGIGRPLRPSRNDILGRVGLVERRFFNGAVVQAALVETVRGGDNAYAVLVFRGTSGRLSNWLFNLDMVACPWPSGGAVHRGFKNSLESIWDAIAPVLERVRRPLFFTGHSLGGALATLGASLHPPRAVYAFGAPRVGDAAFARSLAGVPVYNVFNPKDIVPGLPPSGPWSRFTHAGTIFNNSEMNPDQRTPGQAPAFLAGHAPLNYSAQLPAVFDN